MSVAACEQKCDELQGCTGIVVQPASGGFSCYRKADIDLSRCDSGTNFDTYLKPNVRSVPLCIICDIHRQPFVRAHIGYSDFDIVR